MKTFLLSLVLLGVGCADPTDKTETDDTSSEEVATINELQPGVNEMTLEQEIEGEMVERSYVIHLPDDYDGTASTPLLFAFHGNGGTGEQFIDQFIPPVAGNEFIGVYPNGIANSWNIEYEESKADDIAFTTMILQSLEGIPGIDTSKPVGLGFSNGSALVHKIGVETDLFVAIVPQVSQLLENNQPQSDGSKISVMQFMGTLDDLCPYDGGEGILGYNFMSAEGSAASWAAHNGCDSTATEVQVDEHVKMEWENCEENRRVIHYKLNDVGHEVPPNVDGGTNARIIEFLLEARQ